MTIRLLVLHRTERYPGEYLPEILAVVDEGTMEENFDWWTKEVKKHKAAVGENAGVWAEVEMELDVDELMALLYPANKISAHNLRAAE